MRSSSLPSPAFLSQTMGPRPLSATGEPWIKSLTSNFFTPPASRLFPPVYFLSNNQPRTCERGGSGGCLLRGRRIRSKASSHSLLQCMIKQYDCIVSRSNHETAAKKKNKKYSKNPPRQKCLTFKLLSVFCFWKCVGWYLAMSIHHLPCYVMMKSWDVKEGKT